MQQVKHQSVAVITSTIGREQLIRAIESVKAQTYPCKHYVFVDGEQFFASAKKILDQYPDVIATYLPMNTGANGWTNSSINAIAPFLTKEDVICYLDDDNWYEPNHVESCLNRLNETGADYVFAMRKFFSPQNKFICEDIIESLGFYKNKIEYPIHFNINVPNNSPVNLRYSLNKKSHIDTNCYAMTKNTAILTSPFWFSGHQNDTNVFQALKNLNLKIECTQVFSVNYILETKKHNTDYYNFFKDKMTDLEIENTYGEILKLNYQLNFSAYGEKYPWEL